MRTINLIALYYYVCQVYDQVLLPHCYRHTKNGVLPDFSDQELITIYLHLLRHYRPRSVKDLHKIAVDHYLDWFPDLPGYEQFNRRLNRISGCFSFIVSDLCLSWVAQFESSGQIMDECWHLTDSMPIVTCAGNRAGRVAPELTQRGYSAAKRLSYWGVKLHAIVVKTRNKLPLVAQLWIGPANEHDHQAQVSHLDQLGHRNVSGDKAFESAYLRQVFDSQAGQYIVGAKDNYGKKVELRQWHGAADKAYNRLVTKLKQDVESLFAHFASFGTQTASVVRSTQGLTKHIMGHLCAALLPPSVLQLLAE